MSVFTYKQIVNEAKKCIKSINENQELGIYPQRGYYFAKAILTPHKDIKRIKTLKPAPNPKGNYISRQVSKDKYLEMAKYLVYFAEKKGRMRNYLDLNANKKLSEKVYVMMLADILVQYDQKGKLPKEINVNSKRFIKPTETGNVVYDTFVKTTGLRPKTLDEVLDYVCEYMHYDGYFDDQESNAEVIKYKSGNCVDLLQWLINMVTPLGYDWKCIHVECRQSHIGHVFGKFRHKQYTDNEWITRDPAAVCQNSIHNVWCEDGYLLAENPDWFLENLHR